MVFGRFSLPCCSRVEAPWERARSWPWTWWGRWLVFDLWSKALSWPLSWLKKERSWFARGLKKLLYNHQCPPSPSPRPHQGIRKCTAVSEEPKILSLCHSFEGLYCSIRNLVRDKMGIFTAWVFLLFYGRTIYVFCCYILKWCEPDQSHLLTCHLLVLE